MDQDRIFNLLWKGLLFAFLLSTILALILIQIVFRVEAQSFEGWQGVALFSISSVIWNLALTVSASTVFFNLYPAVRNNAYYSFLSCFIMPFFIALYVGLEYEGLDKVFYTITIPFFAVQAWFFLKFRMTDFNQQ
jgi:hypothetical protein